MQLSYTQLLGKDVYTFDTKRKTGTVQDVIFDPTSGKVLALRVHHGVFSKSVYDISEEFVRDIEDVVTIENEDALLLAGKHSVKILEILSKGYQIYGAKVFTESKKYLGRVTDMEISDAPLLLSRLVVEKFLMGMFPYKKHVIERGDIIEIQKETIIVKDAVVAEMASVSEDKPLKNQVLEPTPGTSMRMKEKS